MAGSISGDDSNTGAIVGGVVGGVCGAILLIVLIILLWFCCIRKREAKSSRASMEHICIVQCIYVCLQLIISMCMCMLLHNHQLLCILLMYVCTTCLVSYCNHCVPTDDLHACTVAMCTFHCLPQHRDKLFMIIYGLVHCAMFNNTWL